jgi:hypothetical protein
MKEGRLPTGSEIFCYCLDELLPLQVLAVHVWAALGILHHSVPHQLLAVLAAWKSSQLVLLGSVFQTRIRDLVLF